MYCMYRAFLRGEKGGRERTNFRGRRGEGEGGGGDGESFSGYFSKIMDCPSTRGIQFKITT